MMIPLPRPHRKPDFSLATINIVFLLLLFFLTVGTIVDSQELSVEAPETSDLPLDRLPRPLLVISASGGLALDGTSLTEANMVAAAARVSTDTGDPAAPIHILASATLPGRDLVNVVGRLSEAGLQVKLVTLREARN